MLTTTPKIKALALRVDRDRRQIERAALRKLTAIGGKALRHAGHAVRVGADPVQAARDVISGNARLGLPGMTPTLTRAMVMADLYGRRRTALDASRDGMTLSAADDDKDHQRKRDKEALALLTLLGIGADELAGLYAAYRPQAVIAAGRIAQAATQAIQATQAAPSRYTPRHPRNVSGRATLRRPAGTGTVNDLPSTVIRRIADGFESGGLTIDNDYGLRREVGKAVVGQYERGRFTGTPAATESLWGYHYTAILDSRTTQLCRALDGTTAPKDDPFWDQWLPPNHFFCRSLTLPVFRSSALREPSLMQPYATTDDIARFAAIKRQFLSYQ